MERSPSPIAIGNQGNDNVVHLFDRRFFEIYRIQDSLEDFR